MSDKLGELLSAAERSLSDHAHTEQVVRLVNDLRQLETQVDELLGSLKQLAEALDIANARDFCPQPPLVTDIRAGLAAAAAAIRDHHEIPANLQSTLAAAQRVERQFTASVNEAWGAYVRTQIPNADGLDALAATLESVGAPPDQVQRLRRAVTASRRLPRRTPDVQALEDLDRAAADYPEALRSLMGDNHEVRRFADQLASGGAHVDALTPAVRDWMRVHGFDQSFRIVAGRPAGA